MPFADGKRSTRIGVSWGRYETFLYAGLAERSVFEPVEPSMIASQAGPSTPLPELHVGRSLESNLAISLAIEYIISLFSKSCWVGVSNERGVHGGGSFSETFRLRLNGAKTQLKSVSGAPKIEYLLCF